ncbi:MAG: hypothetical protein WA891_15210 [Acidobacteriaceae bacterium]|jgi:hypothetical protein
MRRMFSVAFLSVLLIALPSAFAQRGGRAGGGHSGSIGHSFGGFSGSGFAHRSSGFAARSFATAPRFTSTAPARGFSSGYRFPSGGITAARRPDGRSGFRYRSPYRGFSYAGYPYYANSWELLPWDIGYPGFTGDDDSAADVQQPATSVAPPDVGYRPGYEEEPAYQMGPVTVANSVASEPELILVFNDGHREAIRNYVLTHDALIVMDQAASGRQLQIPLASLDLPATEQAAQQAGLDFSPPA